MTTILGERKTLSKATRVRLRVLGGGYITVLVPTRAGPGEIIYGKLIVKLVI